MIIIRHCFLEKKSYLYWSKFKDMTHENVSRYETPVCEQIGLLLEGPVLIVSGNLGELGNNNIYQEDF